MVMKKHLRLRRRSGFQAAISGRRFHSGRALVGFAVPTPAPQTRVVRARGRVLLVSDQPGDPDTGQDERPRSTGGRRRLDGRVYDEHGSVQPPLASCSPPMITGPSAAIP